MTARAVIIGIDDYAFKPLTTAVNDALAFQAALLKHKLVAAADVTLFTSPAVPGSTTRPTQPAVKDAIKKIRDNRKDDDVLYFYFAGHGIQFYGDFAQTEVRTAVITADFQDFSDGSEMLDVNELVDVLREDGPAQQFYFIDACRNLPYEKPPKVASLNLAPERLGPRAQAVLYSVSPRGTAVATIDGLGVMTSALVRALDGEGLAAEPDDVTGDYRVTALSVAAEVKRAVSLELAKLKGWTLVYNRPEYDPRGPDPKPMRQNLQLNDRPLKVVVDPPGPHTALTLSVRLGGLILRRWESNPPDVGPPSFDPALPRRLYGVVVERCDGVAHPMPAAIDLRTDETVTITIRPAGGGPQGAAVAVQAKKAATGVVANAGFGGAASALALGVDEAARRAAPAIGHLAVPLRGTLVAEAREPVAVVTITGRQSSFHVACNQRLEQMVPPGLYEVSFRIGTRVFSRAEVYVGDGEIVTVTPQAGDSPLEQALVDAGQASSVTPSESVGPMQGAVLPTLIPLLALKTFDHDGVFLGASHIAPIYRIAAGASAVVVVVAYDGDIDDDALKQLDSVRATSTTQVLDGAALHAPVWLRPFVGRGGSAFRDAGLARIRHAVLPSIGRSFGLRIDALGWPPLELTAATLPDRITVVGVVVHPDGAIDVSQNLLLVPGRAPHAKEREPRFVRDLQLGQQLFAAGELGKTKESAFFVQSLLYAKWTDPVLGCMGLHAARNSDFAGNRVPASLLSLAADNLERHFGMLADVQCLNGHVPGGDPLLLASLRAIADIHPVARARFEELAARVLPKQPWVCFWRDP